MKQLLCLILTLLFFSSAAVGKDQAAPQTIAQFTRSKIHHAGFFDLYYDETKGDVYLEIDKFKQAFIFQSSMPRGVGSNDIGLDRGLLGNTRLVQFERYGAKVLLKQLNTKYRASSVSLAEQASVEEAFAQSVIASFDIVAQDSANKARVIVKYTEFLLSDVDRMSAHFVAAQQGSFKVNRPLSVVYPDRSKAFPDNTELEALLTFSSDKPGDFVQQVAPEAHSVSVHLHHSLVRLPDDSYEPREFHPYSGFWKFSYQDYSVPIEQPMEIRSIPRHRLQKKTPGSEKSEAQEPIVYYLDPGVPEPIRSALKDGALWWNEAFERIGYRNAFQVKILPADADPMDVRYNVIQWVHRATRGWSYGSSVLDPRTGEIIKGHVTLGSLRVRQDYLLAVGLSSPFTADNTASSSLAQKQMALARIRQLAAHEVGHTLGLAHNFAASADNRASVMDYPHPQVSLRNNTVSLENAYGVGLGQWDYHTIAYGYQDFPAGANNSKALAELVSQTKQQGLRYQSDPDSRSRLAANSIGHLWDGGKEPVAELIRIGKIRAVALQNFGLNSIPQGTPLSSLEETLVPIYLLHRYQLDAVVKLIGGVSYGYELKGDNDAAKGVRDIGGEQQRRAMAALLETISPEYLAIPASLKALLVPKAYGDTRSRESFSGRTGLTFDPLSAAESAAAYSLSLLLDSRRLNRLSQQHAALDEGSVDFGIDELLSTLLDATVLNKKHNEHEALRNRINYLVVDQLMATVADQELAPEVRAELLASLRRTGKTLAKNKRDVHSTEIARLLDLYWRTGQWQGGVERKPLPPGSPI